MLKRDILTRMIEQFGRFLAQMLFNLKSGNIEEAQETIKSATDNFLGMDPDTLFKLPNQDLIALLGSNTRINATKCYIAAQILRLEGQLHQQQNNPHGEMLRKLKSLDLFLNCFNSLEPTLKEGANQELEQLLEETENWDKPIYLLQTLIAYNEVGGNFAEAENFLFELAEKDSQAAAIIGEQFYETLQKKDDDELEKGNLSREELLEGLKELRKMSN